jgi:sulfur-oxidizing protein SoxY
MTDKSQTGRAVCLPMTRRQILEAAALGAAAFATTGLVSFEAEAGPKDAKKKLADLTGVDKPKKGRVTVELPDVTDQAALVPVRVTVDSPMSADDYVKAIHIVAERNTLPEIASFNLGPANGVAQISTRIRVKETQIIVAAAQMSDGSVYIGRARCRVVGGAGGCG